MSTTVSNMNTITDPEEAGLELLTDQIAVDGYILKEIPEHLRSLDICITAMCAPYGTAVIYVPQEILDKIAKNREYVKRVVSAEGHHLHYFTSYKNDYEIVKLAVSNTQSSCIRHASVELQNNMTIVFAAVKHNPFVWESISDVALNAILRTRRTYNLQDRDYTFLNLRNQRLYLTSLCMLEKQYGSLNFNINFSTLDGTSYPKHILSLWGHRQNVTLNEFFGIEEKITIMLDGKDTPSTSVAEIVKYILTTQLLDNHMIAYV